MWKASTNVAPPELEEADDWETDPDFVNDVTEHEQRWGPGGRNVEAIDMAKLREEVFEADSQLKKKQYEAGPKCSYGYGGKFGVQQDRMDRSAVGHDYVGKTEKHVSQKDYAQVFSSHTIWPHLKTHCTLRPVNIRPAETEHSRALAMRKAHWQWHTNEYVVHASVQSDVTQP